MYSIFIFIIEVVDLPPEPPTSASERTGADLLVAPLGGHGVAALEVEPGVGLEVVDLVEGVGDGAAIQVAARGLELVEVEVVRGAAVGYSPDGLEIISVSTHHYLEGGTGRWMGGLRCRSTNRY